MFSKERLENFANILIWGLHTSKKQLLSPGDVVLVQFSLPYWEFAAIVQGKLLSQGFNVIVEMFPTPLMEKNTFELSGDKQLKFLPQWIKDKNADINGIIQLIAPEDLTHLKDVDPKKIATFVSSKKPIREIRDAREMSGEYGWTICVLPTQALATASNMSLEEYEEEVARICHLDDDDPIWFWEVLHEKATKAKDYLNSLPVDHFNVVSDSGRTNIDIYPIEFVQWIGVEGSNIPSFEIYTSPNCHKTQGDFFANTVMFRDGNEVSGVQLRFKDGRVVEASAEKGNDFLQAQLNIDENSNMLGEFSLTDKTASTITRNMSHILYDENVGGEYGNSHIALGNGFPNAYCGKAELTPELRKEIGINNSSLHWDVISTESKRVTAFLKDGSEVVIYENGSFIIPQ